MRALTKGQMAALALAARYFLTYSKAHSDEPLKWTLRIALEKLEDGIDGKNYIQRQRSVDRDILDAYNGDSK